MEEEVFGIPRAVLEEAVGRFQGFLPADEGLPALARRLEALGEFRPRAEVEEDADWQQVIPYVALSCGARILLLERLASQGERRLHHLLSIGVGGHVRRETPGAEPLLVRGLRREVEEEVSIDLAHERPPELLGFINDDSNAVGRVHFGLACRLEVERPVEVREKDRMRGSWVERALLRSHEGRFESWSRILAGALVASD